MDHITQSSSNKQNLGVFALIAMGIAAVLSLRNFPVAAMYGAASISYYLLGAFLFFIPTAMVSSFLTREISDAGGLYAWVRAVLGPRYGFLAIWFEWIDTVIAFPMMLGFILYTLIFPLAPVLSQNKWCAFTLFLVLFWGLTLLNFLGIKLSSRFTSICVALGTLFPALLIIVLGAIWYGSGKPIAIDFTWASLTPSFDFKNLAFLIAVINGFSGIQIIAFHRQQVQSPQQKIPRAMGFIVCIISLLSILATISIAIVMQNHQGNIIGGLIQSLGIYFSYFHLDIIVPVIAVLIAIGVLAEINAWIIGPSKGLHQAASDGFLPKPLARMNQKGVPTSILILQAVVGSTLGLAYICMSSVNSGYWLLSDLTAQFTLLMWLLVFSSAVIRAWQKRRFPVVFAGVIGFFVALFILIVSYFPPSQVVNSNEVWLYEGFLFLGLIFFTVIPIILNRKYQRQKVSWVKS